MAYKKQKDLLSSRSVYNQCYSEFRGVDFSSDHTDVLPSRFAYAVNVYKDYQSGQGAAVETIAGFRRRFSYNNPEKVLAIHKAENDTHILAHIGSDLLSLSSLANEEIKCKFAKEGVPIFEYSWGEDTNVLTGYQWTLIPTEEKYKNVVEGTTFKSAYINGKAFTPTIGQGEIRTVLMLDAFPDQSGLGGSEITLTVDGVYGDTLNLYQRMSDAPSKSVLFNNRLYIVDGQSFLEYDPINDTVSPVTDIAYIPTTYSETSDALEEQGYREEYEQDNLLSGTAVNKFYVTEDDIKGDTTKTMTLYLRSKGTTIDSIKINGEEVSEEDIENNVAIGTDRGYIVSLGFNNPDLGEYEIQISGISHEFGNINADDAINGCTLITVFDNRIFLSGNPNLPNHIFWCGISKDTGLPDPTYWGAKNFVTDGISNVPITGMIPVANALMVLKRDTEQDGAVFYHTPQTTSDPVIPVTYPSEQGLNGIGCLGACTNFLDDPVFLSRLGLEGIGTLSVRLERAIEHRSSLVDAKLVNLKNLDTAQMVEWNGYLCILIEGKMFLADSRQRYTDSNGIMQYEWYYLEDIGVYQDQKIHFTYALDAPDFVLEKKDEFGEAVYKLADSVYDSIFEIDRDLRGTDIPDDAVVQSATVVQSETKYGVVVEYITVNEVNYIVSTKGDYIGGTFHPAISLKVINGNLFFGTTNGTICSFNFDKRNEYGEIPSEYYNFDGRAIFSGVATKMDNCGIPHLTKTTVKKGTVIKTRVLPRSAAKIKVRTNRDQYKQIGRIVSSSFSFEDLDFTDLSFATTEQTLFAITERTKRWVEKQYFVYSDEYNKPFALFYIAFRYSVTGRYKE